MNEANFDIIGLGLATVDVLIRLKELPTWENCSGFSGFAMDGGGMAATACCAASHLGARVGFAGTAGNDEMAAAKLKSLCDYGVDINKMVRRDEPESQVVLVYVHEETGERTFSGMRKFGVRPLQVDELDQAYLTATKFLHLDGFHVQAAIQAARWARQAGVQVSLDGSKTGGGPLSPEMISLVGLTDILICASGFGASLTGYTQTAEIGAAALRYGPSIIVQTEGEQGCTTTTANEHFHTPAFPIAVLDTTGAGDVFHGAYLVGLLHGWGLNRVARFASAAAAIKCTQMGGRRGIPTFDQTLAFLENTKP